MQDKNCWVSGKFINHSKLCCIAKILDGPLIPTYTDTGANFTTLELETFGQVISQVRTSARTGQSLRSWDRCRVCRKPDCHAAPFRTLRSRNDKTENCWVSGSSLTIQSCVALPWFSMDPSSH